MTYHIIGIANPAYRYHLTGLAAALKDDGFHFEFVTADDFVQAPEAIRADCLLTIHSLDKALLDTLAAFKGVIPTLTLQDGIIEYAHCCLKPATRHRYHPVATDVLLSFGERPCQLINDRHADNRAIATGAPRFDPYHAYRHHQPSRAQPMLITTANTPWYDEASQRDFIDCFAALLQEVLSADATFKLRLPDKVKKALETGAPDILQDIRRSSRYAGATNGKTPLLDDLLSSAAVITTPSTVALEAMMLNLPAAIVQTGAYPMYLESAFTISSGKGTATVLSSLLARDEDYDNRMRYQAMIKRSNVIDDGQATQRVVGVIKTMLGQAQP